MNSVPHRFRVRFSKDGDLRFIGHLDLQRLFERALRRSGLPLRYSQGFNPKVRLNLACALPLGFSSDCELMDFWLDEEIPTEDILARFSRALPTDLKIWDIEEVSNKLPSLQSSTAACEYEIRFPAGLSADDLKTRLDTLLEQDSIIIARKKKDVDIRPLLLRHFWEETVGGVVLRMVMSATPQATGRPDEWITLMNLDFAECEIHRSQLILTDNANVEETDE